VQAATGAIGKQLVVLNASNEHDFGHGVSPAPNGL
jgi:hypothetical protein